MRVRHKYPSPKGPALLPLERAFSNIFPLALAEHRRRCLLRILHCLSTPQARGYSLQSPPEGDKLREFAKSRHIRGAPTMGLNARQSEGPAVKRRGPRTSFCSGVARPHDARFFCTLKSIKSCKKMNKQIKFVAEPVNSDLAQRTRY